MTLVHDATVAEWPVWSTTARVVVTDPAALAEARFVVECELDEVERACSRFRPSELAAVAAAGAEVEVSELLAELVGAALEAARRTDGDVDPTLGEALAQLGYDRDLPALPPDGPAVPVQVRPAPGWQRIRLTGRRLFVPPGVRIDLGATAKALAADRAARHAAGWLGTGVLVELGGDGAPRSVTSTASSPSAGMGGGHRLRMLPVGRAPRVALPQDDVVAGLAHGRCGRHPGRAGADHGNVVGGHGPAPRRAEESCSWRSRSTGSFSTMVVRIAYGPEFPGGRDGLDLGDFAVRYLLG